MNVRFHKKGSQTIRKTPDDKREFWVGRRITRPAAKNAKAQLGKQVCTNQDFPPANDFDLIKNLGALGDLAVLSKTSLAAFCTSRYQTAWTRGKHSLR
jgi:hypothetical protein